MLDKVKKIIARHLEVDDKNIRLDTFLVNDLHASPAQIDGLIASMEKEFMIKIPQNDLYRFRKVKDIIDYLEARV